MPAHADELRSVMNHKVLQNCPLQAALHCKRNPLPHQVPLPGAGAEERDKTFDTSVAGAQSLQKKREAQESKSRGKIILQYKVYTLFKQPKQMLHKQQEGVYRQCIWQIQVSHPANSQA